MAGKRSRGNSRGVYEKTPFLSALDNVGFVENPGDSPYGMNNIRNSRAQRATAGPNTSGFTAFGTGSERGSDPTRSKASKDGGALPHERLTAFAAQAEADAKKQMQDTTTTGQAGNTLWDADWAYNNPQQGVLNWLESMGYYVDDLNPDPFTQYMQAISAGLPYLYRFSGMQGDTGTGNYGNYLEGYTNAMLNTPAGQSSYADNALYDWNELTQLINVLGAGGGDLGRDIGGPADTALGMLKSLPPDQAMQALMGILAASSSTAMTPLDFAIMQDEIERGWSQYSRQNTTPRAAGAEGTSFWDYLQSSGVLGRLFG